MDLFSIQSMINNSFGPPSAPSSSSSPNASSSSSLFQLSPAHSHGGSSPFEIAFNQMPTPPSSSELSNAFPPPPMISSVGAPHHQFDPELLQSVAHHLRSFSFPFCGTSSADSSSTSPPLNALLLLLLQQFRALSNSQSAVPFASVCPSSALPLCVSPDFRPLFPADWSTKNAATNPLNCFTSSTSPLAFEQQQQICSLVLSDFAATASSSSSCSGSGSVEQNSPGGVPKAFGAVAGAAGGGTAHRLSYPREFKLLVLKSFWANGQNKYRTCKEFQITKSMLNGWLQKAERIRRSRPGSLKSGRSGRRPQFPKIEQKLFEMVQNHLEESGECASNKWIRKMARKLTTAPDTDQNSDRKAKEGERVEKREREAREAEEDERVEKREREAREAGEDERVEKREREAREAGEDERVEKREKEGREAEENERAEEQCQFSERWLNNFKRRYGIQTVAECTVNTEGDEEGEEAEEDEAQKGRRQAHSILMEAISPPHSPLSPFGPTDELWQDEEQWRSIAWEICASSDRLPIQAFYDRFPKVLQQTNGGGTTKRERNGAKNGH